MSLYGLLTTSASGMAAQSTLLGTVADNIANVGTTGYKNASAEFDSLVLDSNVSNYQSGSVLATARISVDAQGGLTSTNSTTDLAVEGGGFFIVQGPGGQPVLNARRLLHRELASGNLVNSAGYTLLGYPAGTTGAANGFNGPGSGQSGHPGAQSVRHNLGPALSESSLELASSCLGELAFRKLVDRRLSPRRPSSWPSTISAIRLPWTFTSRTRKHWLTRGPHVGGGRF